MADISDKAKKPSNDKQKPIRKSTRLQERVAQQSEPLDYTLLSLYYLFIYISNQVCNNLSFCKSSGCNCNGFSNYIVMNLVLTESLQKIINNRSARFKLALFITALFWNQKHLGINIIPICHLQFKL